ncbi:MAG TPA: DUF4124 domain-containing protein [Thiobacillus sp.]|nr:DUF4124 domain-containing protein [Thiobacillus sp.]
MVSAYAFPLLLAGLAWQTGFAAPLYKWVDSAGHVTYSSFPPPAGIPAQKLPLPPRPSAEEILQAEARAKRIEEQASALEAQRLKREAQAAEEARLRAMRPPTPVVIEKPVYVPQPIYFPPVMKPPRRHRDKPPFPKPREK